MLFFFFNDTATTEIYTLSLHDALPISDKDNCTLNNLMSLCDHVKGSCHGLTRGKEHLFAEGFRSMLKRCYGYKYEKEGSN